MSPSAGIAFKPQHFAEALACPADGLWFEVHAENYMVAGGPRLAMLEALRCERPLSLHGVGLSLAGVGLPDPGHLAQLKRLVDRFEPMLVSEHLAWSRLDGMYLPDLLPFPRTGEALRTIVRNIDATQQAIGRAVLIENPTHYIALPGHCWSETDFLYEIVRRTGCGLLIDVNNIFVSANNIGGSAEAYVDALDPAAIGEIHIAGHSVDPVEGAALLIDSHDAPVAEPVWALAERLIRRGGEAPVLLERDGAVPSFAELMAERDRAARMLARSEDYADA